MNGVDGAQKHPPHYVRALVECEQQRCEFRATPALASWLRGGIRRADARQHHPLLRRRSQHRVRARPY